MPADKFRRYFLLSLFALITALLISLWLFRTELAETTLVSTLEDAGLDAVDVDIAILTANYSHLPYFSFTLITETGILQVALEDSSIRYTIEGLKKKHIDSLQVDRLILRYQANNNSPLVPSETDNSLQPVRMIATLRQGLRRYLLLDTLNIQQIILRGEAFRQFQEKTFQLKSRVDDHMLSSELSVLEQESVTQSLSIALSEKLLKAEMRTTDKDVSAAGIDLDISDTRISGEFKLRPLLLKNWLASVISTRFAEDFETGEITDVDGDIVFDFSADKYFITEITARTRNIRNPLVDIDNAVIRLKAKNKKASPLQQIEILNGSYIKSDKIDYQGYSLTGNQTFLVGELSNIDADWSYKGGFSSPSIKLQAKTEAFKLKDLAGSIKANAQKLNIFGNFKTALPGQFVFSAIQDNITRSGEFSVGTTEAIALSAEDDRLSRLITPWPYPFDLTAGKLQISLSASWSAHDDNQQLIKIVLEDNGGSVGDILFSGLSLQHELAISPVLRSVQPESVSIRHIDSGITADNISAMLKLETIANKALPLITVRKLKGEILGGTFSSDELHYDLNNTSNRFHVDAKNIDLAEIVKTQQLDDIVATGRIDGNIPITLNEDGVFIEHGIFINGVRNGTIRYNPKTGTGQLQQNPVTGIALDALKDFRYSYLSAGVNFTPEGKLTINLQLRGTSPALDTSRPVHLNINTEQNLLTLLKSLRYAQGVSEKIDNRVRRQYEKKQNKSQDL